MHACWCTRWDFIDLMKFFLYKTLGSEKKSAQLCIIIEARNTNAVSIPLSVPLFSFSPPAVHQKAKEVLEARLQLNICCYLIDQDEHTKRMLYFQANVRQHATLQAIKSCLFLSSLLQQSSLLLADSLLGADTRSTNCKRFQNNYE